MPYVKDEWGVRTIKNNCDFYKMRDEPRVAFTFILSGFDSTGLKYLHSLEEQLFEMTSPVMFRVAWRVVGLYANTWASCLSLWACCLYAAVSIELKAPLSALEAASVVSASVSVRLYIGLRLCQHWWCWGKWSLFTKSSVLEKKNKKFAGGLENTAEQQLFLFLALLILCELCNNEDNLNIWLPRDEFILLSCCRTKTKDWRQLWGLKNDYRPEWGESDWDINRHIPEGRLLWTGRSFGVLVGLRVCSSSRPAHRGQMFSQPSLQRHRQCVF